MITDHTRALPLLGREVETADRASGATAHVPQCRQLHHPTSWITELLPTQKRKCWLFVFHFIGATW